MKGFAMFIKKYAFLVALFAFSAVSVSYSMHDHMDSVIESLDQQALRKEHEKVSDALSSNEPLQQVIGHIDTFSKIYVRCTPVNDLNQRAYLEYFLEIAAKRNRLDVLVAYEYFIENYNDVAEKKEFLESLAIGAFTYGSADTFKYVWGKMIGVINKSPLCKRLKYDFYYDREHTKISLEPVALCLHEYTSCTTYLKAWDIVFTNYWDRAHALSAQYMPDLSEQLQELRQKLPSRVDFFCIDFSNLDEDAKSFFDGSYYSKAMVSICDWYKNSDGNTKKIIKESAQMCGHYGVFKALLMCDNPIVDNRVNSLLRTFR